MAMRRTGKSIVFSHPFELKGVDRILPPGDYRVVTDEHFHDRWLQCDNNLFALGGSIKDIGNGTTFTITRIDTTAAIWFYAGRMPPLRTLGSAILSIFVVGMGASLGREGAPKQVGAVIANVFSDRELLSDEQRRLVGSG